MKWLTRRGLWPFVIAVSAVALLALVLKGFFAP